MIQKDCASVSDPAFTLREPPASGFLNLRIDLGDAAFEGAGARVADVLGAALPLTPNVFARGEAVAVYWLGPGEWLLATPRGSESALEERLRHALDGCRGALVDVSGAYALFELGGEKAEEVLRKSSPYDFHHTVFAPPRCAQTVFAKTYALIAAKPDRCFELIVRASYADYVRAWIAAAASEYGRGRIPT